MDETADQIAAKKTELEQRERSLAVREATARREDAVSFAEGLVKGGKVLPRQKAQIVELLLALPAGTTLEFAEGDNQVKVAAIDTLRTFLTDLPQRLDFSEKSAGGDDGAVVDFAAPGGLVVDAAGLDLHAKALAHQRAHPNESYLDAVRAVSG